MIDWDNIFDMVFMVMGAAFFAAMVWLFAFLAFSF